MKKILKFNVPSKLALKESYDFNDGYDGDGDDYDDDDIVAVIDNSFIDSLKNYGVIGDFCTYEYNDTTGWLRCTPNGNQGILYDFQVKNNTINIYQHKRYGDYNSFVFTQGLIAFIKDVSMRIGEMKALDTYTNTIVDVTKCVFTDEYMQRAYSGSDYENAKSRIFTGMVQAGMKSYLRDGIIDDSFIKKMPDLSNITGGIQLNKAAQPIFKSMDVYMKMKQDPKLQGIADAFVYRSTYNLPNAYYNSLPPLYANDNSDFILVWDGTNFPHYEKIPD